MKQTVCRMALLALGLRLACAEQVQAASLPDDAVKAAVIYKVMLFTRWPSGAAAETPLTLCVLGRDEVAAALPDIDGKQIGSRPLQVRSVAGQAPFSGCNAVYLAASERHRLDRLREQGGAEGLMTVVDCGGVLCHSAAVLSLAVEDGRLVFAVNRQQAEQQGLVFSAQVLRLARLESAP
ncbi:MAG: YfiR family protein [Pseudomonadota bacterium]